MNDTEKWMTMKTGGGGLHNTFLNTLFLAKFLFMWVSILIITKLNKASFRDTGGEFPQALVVPCRRARPVQSKAT